MNENIGRIKSAYVFFMIELESLSEFSNPNVNMYDR